MICSMFHIASYRQYKKPIKISINCSSRIAQSRNDYNLDRTSRKSSSHHKSQHNSSSSSSRGTTNSINWHCIDSKYAKYKNTFTVAETFEDRTPSFTRRNKSPIAQFSVFKSLPWVPPLFISSRDKQDNKEIPDIVQNLMKILHSRNNGLSNVCLTIYSSAEKKHRQQAAQSAQLQNPNQIRHRLCLCECEEVQFEGRQQEDWQRHQRNFECAKFAGKVIDVVLIFLVSINLTNYSANIVWTIANRLRLIFIKNDCQ